MSVRQLCEQLHINRDWYYVHQHQSPNETEAELRDAMEQIVLDFPSYGYRRVTAAFVLAG